MFRLTVVTVGMAPFKAIPLGIYTLGPPRLPQLEASPELPLWWCCPALPAIRLAFSWYLRIFGFSSLWTRDVTRGLGGRARGWKTAAVLFSVKNCWTDSLVGWRVVIMQESAMCTPFVWVFSLDIHPQRTQDIVNRTPSALVDDSTDICCIVISPTLRWTT
jgi:hypothetical protein